jgi:hypothetical protein
MFKNLLEKVQTLIKSGNNNEAVEKLQEALNAALADNVLTPEELQEVMKLQTELGVSDADMADIKLKVLDNLTDKLNSDGKIDEAEIQLFNTIKASLGINIETELGLKEKEIFTKENFHKGLDFLKTSLIKVKNQSVNISGSLINKAKDMIKPK